MCGGDPLKDDFHKIDTNGDGYISLQELNVASKLEGGDEVTQEQWQLMCEFVQAKPKQGINQDFGSSIKGGRSGQLSERNRCGEDRKMES